MVGGGVEGAGAGKKSSGLGRGAVETVRFAVVVVWLVVCVWRRLE